MARLDVLSVTAPGLALSTVRLTVAPVLGAGPLSTSSACGTAAGGIRPSKRLTARRVASGSLVIVACAVPWYVAVIVAVVRVAAGVAAPIVNVALDAPAGTV